MEELWDTVIMEQFVRATNSFARNSTLKILSNWRDVSKEELFHFLSIAIFLGLVKLPSRDMAWDNTLFGSPFCIQTHATNYNKTI